MNSLKDRFRTIRGSKTQASFSAEIGIPLTTLGRYERGDNPPDINHVISVCNKYNISTDWLLLGKGPMRPAETPQIQEPHGRTPTLRNEPVVLCTRCIKLEEKLERMEDERRGLSGENRELSAENRRLWKENGDLRERCAKLEVR